MQAKAKQVLDEFFFVIRARQRYDHSRAVMHGMANVLFDCRCYCACAFTFGLMILACVTGVRKGRWVGESVACGGSEEEGNLGSFLSAPLTRRAADSLSPFPFLAPVREAIIIPVYMRTTTTQAEERAQSKRRDFLFFRLYACIYARIASFLCLCACLCWWLCLCLCFFASIKRVNQPNLSVFSILSAV